eukprot:352861-Chlamydomonas_euryale.AAC.20
MPTALPHVPLAAPSTSQLTRRRPDELGHTVPLHVLGHVEPHHRVTRSKVALRKHLCKLGLADARGADKQHARDRAVGVLEPGACAHESGRECLHCCILPDDMLL